ncbi:TonB-dependent receptor [Ancylobacter defluvii]|uniref:TonB dependent/Ligand-Gated channel TonB n=1 Tax=Ancylobacter defluvii TaxID=1282440 RepID=A0A9W6NA04_9HYPH|nr:TonB-dependent siderophore receptor [Ancylobacter defluvii]MBS7590015.1 TonB-dependent siderophore receptor [Ancylobacter defluvii]GLK83143.1 TonB dependent/Ligand-Gated channel TonB [Ancylobacter defluvii]
MATTFLMVAAAGITGIEPARAQATVRAAYVFDIPAKSIRAAMNDIVRVTGIDVVFRETPAASRLGNPVRGSLTAGQAVAMLLGNSGLAYRFSNPTTVEIFDPTAAGAPGSAADGAIALDTIQVEGSGTLPAPYAGGQIATGGTVGVLGVRDVMDTPFTVANYTSKLIDDQNAQSIADVVKNDPAIRNVEPTNTGNANYFLIRGIQVGNGAVAFGGLFGVAPNSQSTLAGIERVEVLKGPGAFLNGLSPSGVGGVINLVPKRAGDDPLTELTTTYITDSQFGAHLDIGRRFGEDKEWGVRGNLLYRDGDTPVSDQSQELMNATLGIDYKGEKLRLALDLGTQILNTDRMNNTVTPAVGAQIPRPPSPEDGWVSPWNYSDFRDNYGMLSAEYDITDNIMVYAKAGIDTTDWDQAVESGTNLQYNGDFVAKAYRYLIDIERQSGETGVRASFDTGPVAHQLALSASAYSADRWSAPQPAAGTLPTTNSNIYHPTFSQEPVIPTMVMGPQSETSFSSYAISDTLSMLDERLQVTLGLRQQYVDVDNFNIATGAQTGSYSSDALTPMVAVLVKPWERVSLYASYIEGLTAGQVVPVSYANGGEVLPPFTTKQYEAGIKVDWGTLLTTLSVFHTTQASGIANAATNTFTSDGETVYRGIEFDVAGEIAPWLRILGGFVLLDAEMTETANGAFNGNDAAGAPPVTATLGLEWDPSFIENLTLFGRMNATGSAYVDAANTQKIGSWTTFDFGARYKIEREGHTPIIVQANLTNAFNEAYWTTYPGFNLLYSGEARTLAISTVFTF